MQISSSPDLALNDSYLFPKLKEILQATKFNSDDKVMTAVEEFNLNRRKYVRT